MFSIIRSIIPFIFGNIFSSRTANKEINNMDISKPISSIVDIVDSLHFSGEEKAAFEIEKEKLHYQLSVLQSEIMKAELQSGRGKWRSAIGWICAYCLGIYFAVQPTISLITSIASYFKTGSWIPIRFDVNEIMELLASVLCVGTLKTIEKIKMRQPVINYK